MIRDLDDLRIMLDNYRSRNQKVGFTNGCFDILHKGHVDYLNKARQLGDVLILGLNSDKSVKELKGNSRPIVSEEDRAFILENLKAINSVVLFDEETPKNLIEFISPDVLVKGGDYTIETIVGADFVLKNGGEVKTIQFVDGCSTSSIIDKILASEKSN